MKVTVKITEFLDSVVCLLVISVLRCAGFMPAEQPTERKPRMLKVLVSLCFPSWFVMSVLAGYLERSFIYCFPPIFLPTCFFWLPLSITIKLKKVQKIDTVWVTENFLHHFFSPLDPPKSSDLIWRNLNSFWGQHFWVTALDALRRISTFWSPFSKAIYLNFEILSHLSWSLPALLVLLYVFYWVPANLVTNQSKEYFKCRVHTQKSFHWRPANA